MAFEIPGRKVTAVCGAASLAAKKHYFVKLHTDGTAIVPAQNTDLPYGILQNNPGVGGEAEIMRDGISKLVASEAVAIGDLIGTASDGRAEVMAFGTDTTKFIVGIALTACGSGEVFSVDFNCAGAARGA